MFRKILIANRGEIACRIIKTARRLGIATVAVYSDADADALHVEMADEAVHIGPPPAAQSYLLIDKIIDACKRTGAEAVHPGYGFLSERAAFATALADANIVFIGPNPRAIEAMGDKIESKKFASKANVSVVPGYLGVIKDGEEAVRIADEIGYPVMLKASAGGGGKGMRVVEKAGDFATQLAGARREAKGAFADDRVLIEKYLTRPRHIELQVFADSHGNCVHLYERDCSLQRRHQKVIEEAPAPGLSAERRDAMGKAAIAAARAVDYVGAGTIEFIVEDDHFYFMEMNTRLQVEHPVTEMITGLDLVEWQLRVAAGERLPLVQNEIVLNGHAFEARIYTEDPERDFLPQAGQLLHVAWPSAGRHLRIDAGVESGDVITTHYDPMIAKVIVWDRNRASALCRLTAALDGSAVFGPANNLSFLARIARHPDFAAEAIDTGFIPRHLTELAPPATCADDATLALATLVALSDANKPLEEGAAEPWSPWRVVDGWQPNGTAHSSLTFRDGESRVTVEVNWLRGGGFKLSIAGKVIEAKLLLRNGARLDAQLEDRRMTAWAVRNGNQLWVQGPAGMHRLQVEDPLHGEVDDSGGGGHLTAPMPGVVVSVAVVEGQIVKRGAALMILEAMKMEHTIVAPADGRVATIHFAVGDRVGEGEKLIAIEDESESGKEINK